MVTMGKLVDMYFVSRFNRDNLHDPAEGEDIDNSRLHRIYNKKDIKELMSSFCEFFEWVINEKDISKIYISKNMSLIRESSPPRLKYATKFDEICTNNQCKAGEYYITNGRYNWKLWVEGETFEKMKNLWMRDPEFIRMREELVPEMEEKNKNARKDNNN